MIVNTYNQQTWASIAWKSQSWKIYIQQHAFLTTLIVLIWRLLSNCATFAPWMLGLKVKGYGIVWLRRGPMIASNVTLLISLTCCCGFLLLFSSRWLTRGIPNANVLPLPVCAAPNTSRWSRMAPGRTCRKILLTVKYNTNSSEVREAECDVSNSLLIKLYLIMKKF